MNNKKFEEATRKDLEGISKIERDAFTGVIPDDELFSSEKLEELYDINPDMIYVLKDPESEEVQAFTIVSPLTKECYILFLEDKVQDLVNFSKEEKEKYIKRTTKDYEYCYFTDICTRKSKNGKIDKLLSLETLAHIIKLLLEEKDTMHIVSYPITEEGKNILSALQFKKVNDNIYEVHVTEEVREYYYSYLDRISKIFKRRERKNNIT